VAVFDAIRTHPDEHDVHATWEGQDGHPLLRVARPDDDSLEAEDLDEGAVWRVGRKGGSLKDARTGGFT
jgi:hypothetical protein